MALIHSSYYAMFHAAVRDAPKRHERAIQQFGLLVRNLDDALRSAGKAFNEVKDERTDADYDGTLMPTPDEAREVLRAAIDFLAVCGARYRFRSNPAGP
jgi:uncharacterized protein (UPF0332 family)